MKRRGLRKQAIAALVSTFAVASCGEKGDDDAADGGDGISSLSGTLSLAQLPDAEGMVSANQASLRLAPSGTIPKISELADNYDQYFFNGAVAGVKSGSIELTEEAIGSLDRGESVCQNVGSVAQTFGEMRSGSLCYMKQVPGLSSESVTLEKASDTVTAENIKDTLFAKEDKDKLVHVKVTMEYEGESMQQDIFINVIGRDTAGDNYQFDMYGCIDGKVHDAESAKLDFSTGEYTLDMKGVFSEGGMSDQRSARITAYLKKDGDSVTWDLSKDRSIAESFSHQGEWGTHFGKAQYVLSGDNFVTSYMSSGSSFTDPASNTEASGTTKLWSKASFSGSSVLDLQVGEVAISSTNSHKFGSETFDHTVKGAVEWRDTTYASTTDSGLYKQAVDYAFDSEIYSASPSSVNVDLSDRNCSAEADVIVAFDMGTEEAMKVDASCGGGEEQWETLDALYNKCYGADVQAARQKIWDAQDSLANGSN